MRLSPSYGTMTERHLSAITEVEHPGDESNVRPANGSDECGVMNGE